jgi:zeaxanthin glucosyltransferase
MAHFGFLAPPLPGHINPMLALARELVTRGNRVTFLGFPDLGPRLPDDVLFFPFAEQEQPLGSLQPYLARLGRLGGPLSLMRLVRDLAAFADTICRHLPGALERLQPDALVIDQTDAAGSLAATALGVPFVNIANALPLNLEPGVPPPVLAWGYDPSPKGLRRNRGGYRVARWVERPITRVIRQHAARLGRPDIRFADETWSQQAQITQCVPGLDFPRAQLPANFHYVGPIRGPDEPLDFHLPNDRPLAFCSLGTLQGSRVGLFRAAAKAAATRGVKIVIAHGGGLSERDMASLPGSPIVRAFVPQRAVLGRADFAITHAGFNTVMDALSLGVPMVAMPITFEQPATGARLKRAGAAVVLQRRRTAGRIAAAIDKVLADPSYRRSAQSLQEEIQSAGGVRLAADIIERTLGVAAPPAAATRARAAPNDARGDSRSGSSSAAIRSS